MARHREAGEALSPSAQTADLAGGQRVEVPQQSVWSDMDTAPKTGVPVTLISADGVKCDAAWKSTRKIVVDEKNRASWKPTGFWLVRGHVDQVPFEPVGWKPFAYEDQWPKPAA